MSHWNVRQVSDSGDDGKLSCRFGFGNTIAVENLLWAALANAVNRFTLRHTPRRRWEEAKIFSISRLIMSLVRAEQETVFIGNDL